MARIRLVLFDAFGTLVTPRRPIAAQYGALARSYGLIVSDEDIQRHFRSSFEHFSSTHPLYGKYSSPPLDPDSWWESVIEMTLQNAGVADSDLQTTLPRLGPVMTRHFSTRQAYRLTPDALATLEALHALRHPPLLGVVTNSDPRMRDVLADLGLAPTFIKSECIATSWDMGVAKPDRRAFIEAMRQAGGNDLKASEVLHVGDHAQEDYAAAKAVGMHALLVNAAGEILSEVLRLVEEQDDG